MSIQLPKGTRDFFPPEQRIQNHIFDTWRKACIKFGYEEYEGPIFEHLELYTDKSGDEIVRQLYNFTDKGNRDLALRPEMTPTLARMVNQKGAALRKPLRWFSIPRLFRYERAQKGRLREFFQLNLDIIGSNSIYAEADLISAIVSMLQDFGLNFDDFVIGISSRELLATWFAEIGITQPETVYPVLDKRAKISAEAFRTSLQELDLTPEQVQQLDAFMQCTSVEQIAQFTHSDASQQALSDLQKLFTVLAQAGIGPAVQLDLTIVRGLAYYTGIVFEVFDRKRSMRAVAGGGRYDSLTERLGGVKIPCVGFGMGDVVLADLLAERNLLPAPTPQIDVWLVSFTNNMELLFATAAQVRALGLSCSHILAASKVGKQLESANVAGAKAVIFVDGDRAPAGMFEYKILATGAQSTLSLADIAKEIL